MHTKDFFINNCCDWQTVETIGKGFPELDGIAALAFVIKSINTIDRGTFMVSSEDEKVEGIFDFVSEEEADSFKAVFSSINIISQKEVICFRGEISVFEKSKEIIILSMDIT